MIKFIIDQENGPSFPDNKVKEIVTNFFIKADRGDDVTAIYGTGLGFYYARVLLATTYKHLYDQVEWFIIVKGQEIPFELTKSGRVKTKNFWDSMFCCHWDECLETILEVQLAEREEGSLL